MPELGSLAKSFTRFFIPGLALSIFAILVPLIVWGRLKIDITTLPSSLLIVASLLLGYVLDAVKGYRWTFCYKKYMRQKLALTVELSNLVNSSSDNPDDLISELWLQNKEVYERIFQERAEWVMILETAFSLLIGASVLVVLTCIDYLNLNDINLPLLLVAVGYSFVSWLAALNGIDRMAAHDKKLVCAVKTQQTANELSVIDEADETPQSRSG